MAVTTLNQTTNHGVEHVGVAGMLMEFHTCGTCGVTFGMPKSFAEARRHDGQWWYCPNEHGWRWNPGEPEVSKLRRELENVRNARARVEARLDQEKAHSRALKGVVTKTKRKLSAAEQRAAAGVCPCCNRTFQQLARHMQSKHPDFEPTTAV